MGGRSELGVGSICCLLHSLIAGGSSRQWIHLLGRHVEQGGRATIFAPAGPLAERARAEGIAVVSTSWSRVGTSSRRGLWRAVGRHDAAIVHWDHAVMDAFVPALDACGRAALTMHQAPDALARWFGPEILPNARIPIEAAVEARDAVALVRGESHRRRIATAFDLPCDGLHVLPASIPLAGTTFRPARAEPEEVLALTRLSPEKAAIPLLAVELTRARLASGRRCRLTIAGDGPWRSETTALCEKRLPPRAWRIEAAPLDPIARLAASDLVVAQGLTTLEAAALGRPVVVARTIDENRAGGAVLTAERYREAASDPFGEPELCADGGQLWAELDALGQEDLGAVRGLVESRNSIEVAARALREALRKTAGRVERIAGRLRG